MIQVQKLREAEKPGGGPLKSLLNSREDKQSVSVFSTSLLLSLDFVKCFFWTLISE